MHHDERALYKDFKDTFAHRPDPHVHEVLEAAHPYLPSREP